MERNDSGHMDTELDKRFERTGFEGENVRVMTGQADGSTVGVHDLEVNRKGIDSAVSPVSDEHGSVRTRRGSMVKRSSAGRARQLVPEEQAMDDFGDEDVGDAVDGPDSASPTMDGEQKEEMPAIDVYKPRQATRAQVIARQKWKRDNAGAFQPAASG